MDCNSPSNVQSPSAGTVSKLTFGWVFFCVHISAELRKLLISLCKSRSKKWIMEDALMSLHRRPSTESTFLSHTYSSINSEILVRASGMSGKALSHGQFVIIILKEIWCPGSWCEEVMGDTAPPKCILGSGFPPHTLWESAVGQSSPPFPACSQGIEASQFLWWVSKSPDCYRFKIFDIVCVPDWSKIEVSPWTMFLVEKRITSGSEKN